MTKKTEVKKEDPALQRFVFGLEGGKPVGARFPTSEARVIEIVKAKNLNFPPAQNEEWATLGMQLPVGRVYARGKAFIPAIPKALYEKLAAMLAGYQQEHDKPQGEQTASASPNESQGAPDKTNNDPEAKITSGFPRTWQEIAPGHLVLVQESLAEGWWEATVIERHAEILTLRYRDYPKVPKFTCHVATIAMVNPGADVTAA